MLNFFVSIVLFITLSGCSGHNVEIPPAHKGKILGKNGYAPETLSTSRFRLPWCWRHCDNLALLDVSDTPLSEKLVVFMPKDELNLTVDIRGTMSIPDSEAITDALYAKITATPTNDIRVSIINAKRVYATYGAQALRGIVRSEITKYSIQEVLANRQAIGANIHEAVRSKMKSTKTPLVVSRFELADVQPPSIIVDAKIEAKKREVAIATERAQIDIEVVKSEGELLIAQKDRLVARERAQSIAEQNKIAAKSVTAELLAYRKLETAERIYTALSKSGNTIIVPADSSGFSDITGDAVLSKLLGKEIKK